MYGWLACQVCRIKRIYRRSNSHAEEKNVLLTLFTLQIYLFLTVVHLQTHACVPTHQTCECHFTESLQVGWRPFQWGDHLGDPSALTSFLVRFHEIARRAEASMTEETGIRGMGSQTKDGSLTEELEETPETLWEPIEGHLWRYPGFGPRVLRELHP